MSELQEYLLISRAVLMCLCLEQGTVLGNIINDLSLNNAVISGKFKSRLYCLNCCKSEIEPFCSLI
jgi:hypothetical protein